MISNLQDLYLIKAKGLSSLYPDKIKVSVGMATCGLATGAQEVYDELKFHIEKNNLDIILSKTGCIGFCQKEPIIDVMMPGWPRLIYQEMNAQKVRELIPSLISGKAKKEYLLGKIEKEILVDEVFKEYDMSRMDGDLKEVPAYEELPFFAKQRKIVLRNCGFINPDPIEEYIARGGYYSLYQALTEFTPEGIIAEIKKSGLRGRGGAGFPTGIKWENCRKAKGDIKYIICNADEGDPGAYMDRSILEGDPHSVLEGMLIAAYAIGAGKGFLYVRTEYPLAIIRLKEAVKQAKEQGLMGENIFNSGFKFDLEIREGSGAFVCGEETSLIHSLEGELPEPRQRPPFPVQAGLWGYPTDINNVKTWANIPVIVQKGGDWFANIGTEKSKGTGVFSVVGKINNTGLVEVPMGITLKEIVYDIGEGIPEDKIFKAVQTGGPSGGCIPAELMDLPVDFERLAETGSIMGSGGMIVMDEDTCMVDVAKFFIQFTNEESCGKCTTCRDGSEALLEVLTRITDGDGKEGDIEFLEELSLAIKDASMCGLGTTLPNPVLTTLKYFRDEYEAHVKYKKCPAVVCRGIISSPCHYMCPLKTDVPAYLTLIAQGQFREAMEVVRNNNPLPIICGRVCMAHCEMKCRSRETGGALAVKNLKRFLTDYELNLGLVPRASLFTKKYEEKVAIIGSGPAGLTAGYQLARKGYEVTIFEKLPVAGGMLAAAIPEYRLPKKFLQMEIEVIKQAGVNIKTDSPVENIEELFNEGYKAVLIAVGAHKSLKLGIPDEEVEGVICPIIFLRQVNLGEKVPSLGARVGIIGGGNTAIDAARTAVRLGAKEVTVFYRRTRREMPAIEEEVESALDENIKIELLVAPIKILSENGRLKGVEFIRTKLGEPDTSGRRRPLPIKGTEFIIELDSLLPAVSQKPEIPEGFGIKTLATNAIVVDPETFMTSRQGVFACGDAVRLPEDVTTVMADAQIAAELISKFLRGEELKREYKTVRPLVVIEPIAVEEMAEVSRPKMPKLSPELSRNNFKEAELGFSEKMAMKEAKRCLRCDWELQKLERMKAKESSRVGSA
jgi:NADH-quinone oxidoreductase subunit F